jgi:hypothetical protein
MPRETFDQEMARVAQTLRVREEIAYLKALEEATLTDLPNTSIADQLKEEYIEPVYRIDGLHIVGNFTTITATYKTGKSTLMLNLMRSLVDGDPFLGQRVLPVDRNVAYWNLEIEQNQFLQWASDTGLKGKGRVKPLHLRGTPFPLYHPEFEKRIVAWLQDNEIDALIIDPGYLLLLGWPPVGNGGIENNNDLIAVVANKLQEIKRAGGVTDLFIPLHTGHQASGGDNMHARGGSVWGGYPDHLWTMWKKRLVEGEDEIRHFRATGRSPDFDTILLAFDKHTRLYTAEDSLEGVQNRGRAKAVVIGLIRCGGTAGTAELRKATKGKGMANEAFPSAVEEASRRGYITVDRTGKAHMHTLNLEHPEVREMQAFNGGEEL